jgi:predicted HAD superfamily Cof-like phosphohydrolase
MVRDWHIRFGVVVNDTPTIVDADTAKLRYDLIDEEVEELLCAIYSRNLVQIADALADLKYVVDGTAVSYGIDLEPIFREVHRSNMSKGDPEVVRATNGKILKSRNYTPPNLAPLIQDQVEGVACPYCHRRLKEIPPEEGIDMQDHLAFEQRDRR